MSVGKLYLRKVWELVRCCRPGELIEQVHKPDSTEIALNALTLLYHELINTFTQRSFILYIILVYIQNKRNK